MGGITLFDENLNYVLLGMDFSDESALERRDVTIHLAIRSGVLSTVSMLGYKPHKIRTWMNRRQLLDELVIYAKSPQDYFEIMTTCASLKNQPDFYNGRALLEPSEHLFKGKRAFFASLRDQSGYSGPRDLSVGIVTEHGVTAFTVEDLCLAFNPGSLSLLSVPAFLVLCFMGAFCEAPGNQPVPIGRWIYRWRAPGGKRIRNFDDYHRTLSSGMYLKNNIDLFLKTYALAHAIAYLAHQVERDGLAVAANSFRDVLSYEPLLYVLEGLIARGALRDPFALGGMWKTCDAGIENAWEVNPDLAATLQLADALAPISTTSVSYGTILQVFYGLIDVLPLRDYFGVDRRVKFEFPALHRSDQSAPAVLTNSSPDGILF